MQIKLDKEAEIHKETLFQNEHFNTIDAFKLFDKANDGHIDAEKIMQLADEDDLVAPLADRERLVLLFERFDRDLDGKLNYLEFTKAITPRNHSYVNSYSQRLRGGSIEPAEMELKRQEWVMDLVRVLDSCMTIEQILRDNRNLN